jgi:pSer/pThr/pTyr-binding forkhead associated (FHA) protein
VPRLALRYLGHRAGASLSYFTGASMDLVPGSVFEVPAGGLVIGRRATAALRVASSQVAPAHVAVRPIPDGLAAEDLGSTNGTQVNGADIGSALLRLGDRLTLASGFDFEVVELHPHRSGAPGRW